MSNSMPMGIGPLGFSNLTFKRKFRYTFEVQDICGNLTIPQHYVKLAGLPSIDVDEVEINFLNGILWIPGIARWQTVNVSYYNVANADLAPLYSWLASVYNFTDPVGLTMGSQLRDYTGTGVIKLWDGCGALIETWTLGFVWPKSIDFGSLDAADPDVLTVDLTLRYSTVKYQPICPSFPVSHCCSPCGSNGFTAGGSSQPARTVTTANF